MLEKEIAYGCCTIDSSDNYKITADENTLLIDLWDTYYGDEVSVYIPKEEAVSLAQKILKTFA